MIFSFSPGEDNKKSPFEKGDSEGLSVWAGWATRKREEHYELHPKSWT